jgi:hypothetical protein
MTHSKGEADVDCNNNGVNWSAFSGLAEIARPEG